MAWDDDTYGGGHVAATDLQQIKDNFAVLKSTFKGTSAPANIVAGQLWVDTTNHILKVRNEANSAWLSIWDLANDKPCGQDFTDGAYLDGDKIDIDWNPSNYTPTDVAETSDVNDLSAHLKGLDNKAGALDSAIGSISHDLGNIESYSVNLVSASDASPVVSMTGTDWVTVLNHRIYIPANAEVLAMVANLVSETPGYRVYARFVIGGSNSSTVDVHESSYAWTSESILNVSAKSGWYTMAIQLKEEIGRGGAHMKGYTIVYKQA